MLLQLAEACLVIGWCPHHVTDFRLEFWRQLERGGAAGVSGSDFGTLSVLLHPVQNMGDKKSPTRPKRHCKPPSDEGCWDCSVCTFRNTAEAFKCMMCDVRKGTSTRKPRAVSQLVAQQVPPQFASPTQPKKEKKEKTEKDRNDREPAMKKNSHKKMRPRLKNIDRSSAQHLEVTVGDLTVIITDFKEKAKPFSSSTSSSSSTATSADLRSQSGSSSDNTERAVSRSSSPRGEGSSVNGEAH